jgi:hypothetical protein
LSTNLASKSVNTLKEEKAKLRSDAILRLRENEIQNKENGEEKRKIILPSPKKRFKSSLGEKTIEQL